MTITNVLTALYWLGTVGTSLSMAWLELPQVIRRRELEGKGEASAEGIQASAQGIQTSAQGIQTSAQGIEASAQGFEASVQGIEATAPEMDSTTNQLPVVPVAAQNSSTEEAFAPTLITTSEELLGTSPPQESRPELDETALAMETSRQERYIIENEIGRGGMGIVYSARDTVLDRLVALKALPPEYMSTASTATRFRQEARVLARLTHPHIVQVYDFIETDSGLYIAMELVAGQNLADHIEQSGSMSLTQGIELAAQLAEAMAYAHEQGVLHRDFKPHNVLLTKDLMPKVTDFGLATTAEAPHLTQTGAIMGSPAYMSPEQATGESVGPASDIYSFGATLFHVLSGRPPYTGGVMQIVLQQASSPPPELSELNPEVPASIGSLVSRLLSKKPGDRPAAMSQVADELRQHLATLNETNRRARSTG